MDNRFQDMRDKMNRDREAFFGTDSPQPFFGRESPFFRVSTLFFLRQITEVQFALLHVLLFYNKHLTYIGMLRRKPHN